MKADLWSKGFEKGVNTNFQQGMDLRQLIQTTEIKAKIKLNKN